MKKDLLEALVMAGANGEKGLVRAIGQRAKALGESEIYFLASRIEATWDVPSEADDRLCRDDWIIIATDWLKSLTREEPREA